MLESLSSVDWASIEHAYGPATDVPELLRDLTSEAPEIRRESLRALRLNIIHQGSHWPGCVEAVPFLFELLEAESVRDRGAIAAYLQELAIGGVRPYVSSPPRRPDPTTLPDDDLARRTYEAILARLPKVLPLLHHDDAKLRASMAFLVAWFRELDPTESLRALLDDSDEQVVASTALSLGFRGVDDPRLLPLANQTERELARSAAAIALGWLGRRAEVLDALVATIVDLPDGEGFPWETDLEQFVYPIVSPLAPDTDIKIIEALTKRFRDNYHSDDELAGLLLGWAFPGGKEQPERLIDDLSAIQLDIAIKILVKSPHWPLINNILEGTGLPKSAQRAKLHLGDLPPDLLEARIRYLHEGQWRWWPVWRCLLAGARAAREQAQEVLDAVAQQLLRELTPTQIAWLTVQAPAEVAYNWQDISREEVLVLTSRALALVLGDNSLEPLARQYMTRLFWESGVIKDWQLQAFLHVCVACRLAQKKGEVIDESFDPLLRQALRFAPMKQPLYSLLAELHTPRLEALFLWALTAPIALPDRPRVPLGVWYFLALCPSQKVLEGAVSLLARVPARLIHEPSVVSVFAAAPDEFVERLSQDTRPAVQAMGRRAMAYRRGGALTDLEVRRELRQRFWEGVTLASYNTNRDGMNPCPLCAAVYHRLELAQLTPGAIGAILAPNEDGSEGPRSYTELRGGFLSDAILAKEEEPVTPDSAVLSAVQEAIEGGATGEPQCSEINALHLLAQQVRQRAAAYHQEDL